jgi:hypothetical protein
MSLVDRTPTRCDTDPAGQELLTTALNSSAVQAAATTYDPGDVPDWKPGAFEYAAAVRANLPSGLDPGDFDGVNIAPLVPHL